MNENAAIISDLFNDQIQQAGTIKPENMTRLLQRVGLQKTLLQTYLFNGGDAWKLGDFHKLNHTTKRNESPMTLN